MHTIIFGLSERDIGWSIWNRKLFWNNLACNFGQELLWFFLLSSGGVSVGDRNDSQLDCIKFEDKVGYQRRYRIVFRELKIAYR